MATTVRNLLQKQSATDALKTPTLRYLQITSESTGNLIGNNGEGKITGTVADSTPGTVRRKSIEIPKEIYHLRKDNKLLMDLN